MKELENFLPTVFRSDLIKELNSLSFLEENRKKIVELASGVLGVTEVEEILKGIVRGSRSVS